MMSGPRQSRAERFAYRDEFETRAARLRKVRAAGRVSRNVEDNICDWTCEQKTAATSQTDETDMNTKADHT
jgi:hypothetical protein